MSSSGSMKKNVPPSAAANGDCNSRSVLQRLIDQLLHRRLDDLALRRRLLQQHEEHVLLAIDHEIAAAGTIPFQFAERAGRRRLGVPGIGAHAKAEPEAEAVAREIEIVAFHARARANMIRGHLLIGFGAEILLALKLAAVEYHL